jgi:hypothetical protein
VKRRVALIGVPALLLTLHAAAHHSGTMFDGKTSTAVAGTVRTFQWTNPHCWIQLLVPGDEAPVEWSIEMGSPSQLFSGGWRPGTLKAGDKIRVVIHPTRDGTKGGLFVSATREDGQIIGTPVDTSANNADSHPVEAH